MKKSAEAVLQEIKDISESWTCRPNGNYYNSKISATIYKNKGKNEWKFVHNGVHKNGLETGKDTIPICFADYLKSGTSYANDILENLAATNLSVDSIKKVTGLSEDDIERLIQSPQNENNAAYRAGIFPKKTSQNYSPQEDDLIDWDEFLKDSLAEKPSFKRDRELSNDPSDILDSWITTEALSPDVFKKPEKYCDSPRKIAAIDGVRLPWEKTQKIPKDFNVFYQVFLGAIDIEKASAKLLELYKDDFEERISNSGYAAMAVVTVDVDGIPINDPNNDISISSFPWAYGRCLNNKLEQLSCCHIVSETLKTCLRSILRERNTHGKSLTLNKEKIYYAYNFLIRNCNVCEQDCVEPSFSIMKYIKKPKDAQEENKKKIKKDEKDEKPKTPSPPLLNSFYLGDLLRTKRAFKDGIVGKAFRQYIGDIPSPDVEDLLQNEALLSSMSKPDNTPAGRWPSAGRHPLALMQQTAVNIATTTLQDGGLFSVNGPPGTGKTTLLRDIIASVIIDRAKALSSYEHPKDAFHKKGGLYELDDKLKGHEILIASSNNNAVENISKELPQVSQIDKNLVEHLSYFPTISDYVAKGKEKTWGLSAVALGKSDNKKAFADAFWWSDDISLRTYLKKISGETVPNIKIKDETTEKEHERLPYILQNEEVPHSSHDILENWHNAVYEFNRALQTSQEISEDAQYVKEAAIEALKNSRNLEECSRYWEYLSDKSTGLELEIEETKDKLNHEEHKLKNLEQQKEDFKSLIENTQKLASNPLKRLFKGKKTDLVQTEYHECLLALTKTRKTILLLKEEDYQGRKELAKIKAQLAEEEDEILSLRDKLERWNAIKSESPEIVEKFISDRSPWALTFEEQQLRSPNFTAEDQCLRDDVFVAAIKLHKAFINCAAKPLAKNLHFMMTVLGGQSLHPDQDKILPDLWASLFLVVPVISTTFASVSKMLRGMNQDSFGWLLIDEAGQGTPQAAAGSIYRAKRVISVGDPLQVPPVTTLPQALLDSLATHHGVDPDQFTAPKASIQTLSDQANKYGTVLKRDFDEVRIGAPLLVHRRCQNPMFKISNALAYSNLMVYATAEKTSAIKDVLGESHWIHVEGTSDNKWCPEEGAEALNRVIKLTEELGGMPDLYIISPFKDVAGGMKKLLKQKKSFFESYNISIHNWAKDHVGTVHTFQGKEVEAVFFVLGAPDVSQNGARSWATNQVNILNVAVSRAKCAFYIIGNRDLWGESGYMSHFSSHIPLKEDCHA